MRFLFCVYSACTRQCLKNGQEISQAVHFHCKRTGCEAHAVQAAFLTAALNYASMGHIVDESVKMCFAKTHEAIKRGDPDNPSTVTTKQLLQDVPIYFIMSNGLNKAMPAEGIFLKFCHTWPEQGRACIRH